MKVSINNVIHSALLYQFPKKGNAPDTYYLTLEGKDVKVAMTGGGKHPKYVYFMHNGVSYYLPKNVVPEAGSDITLVAEAAKVVELTTEQAKAQGVKVAKPARKQA